MTYNPAFDGLRGMAVLAILLFQARAPFAAGGYAGVDIFFVLSGYLITSLLLRELEERGTIDLAAFWKRRLLRLTPPLLAMLLVYLPVAPLLWPQSAGHLKDVLLAGFYVADYGAAWWGAPRFLSPTWPLAVEMHFYLLWPLVLLLARRRWGGAALVQVLGVGYLLATLLRWFWIVQGQDWPLFYYRTDTRLSGLVLGACLAAALRDPRWRARLQSARRWLVWMPLVLLPCLQRGWEDLWMPMWGIPLVELATAAVLVAVSEPDSQAASVLSQPRLVWLGKMSYGVCLWHYPVFAWLREKFFWDEVLLVGLPVSLALAALSYYTLEKWTGPRRQVAAAVLPH